MRLFIKKIYQFLSGGQGLTLFSGNDNQTVAPSFATTIYTGNKNAQDNFSVTPTIGTGNESEVFNLAQLATTILTGNNDQQDTPILATTFQTGNESEQGSFIPNPVIPTGTENEQLTFTSNPILPTGNENEQDNIASSSITTVQGNDSQQDLPSGELSVTEGNESASTTFSSTGTGTIATGTDNALDANSEAITLPLGSDSAGFVFTAVATINDFTDTATNTRNTGSTDWTNPTNAQGDFNGTEASFSLASGVVLTTGGATLKCTGLNLPAVPSGFTRQNTYIKIRHRWDVVITTPLTDTATITVELRNGAGTTVLGTIFQRTDDGGVTGGDVADTTSRAALATDTIDVTSIVGANTSFQVWCTTNVSLALATSGDMSWQVDGVHIATTNSYQSENTLSIANATANENDGTMTFTVTRSNSNGATTVDYATSDRTIAITGDNAIVGEDYTSASGNLNFANTGQTVKTFTVPLINNTYSEPDRQLIANLSNASNGIITTGSGTGTIVDDEASKTYLQDFSGNGRDLTAGTATTTTRTCPTVKFRDGRDFAAAANYAIYRVDSAFNLLGSMSGTAVFELDTKGDATNIRGLCKYGQSSSALNNPGNSAFTVCVSDTSTNSNRLFFGQAGTTPTNFTTPDIGLGIHTLTWIRDDVAKTFKAKVDGTQVIDATYTGSPNNAVLERFVVGGRGDGNINSAHDGGIYDLRIWDHVVSQTTLDAIVASSGKCKPEGTEFAWYRLEDT